jgi:hypothetical protein
MTRSCFLLAVLTTISAAALGCGGGGTGLDGTVPVSGTVTQKGTSLAGATVTFAPTGQGARAASAITDANGQFTLTTLTAGDGAFPGDYQVTVIKTETIGKVYTPEEANAYYAEHQTQPPAPEIKNMLDEKYADATTSGLTASVKRGEKNEFTFALE